MNTLLALGFIASRRFGGCPADASFIVWARAWLVLGLVFVHIPVASGEEIREPSAASVSQTAQVIYKGVVGNLLEAAPLESEQRVQLQRMNALLSNPLSARTVAIALGIANPPLMIAGLIWGIWSASQIASAPPSMAAQTLVPTHDRTAGDAASTTLNALTLYVGDGSAPQPAPVSAHIVSAGALATVAGGAAPGDRPLPCNDCVMPMLFQQREMPVTK
ncbi:MAG TPA: hypothetical protein VFI62_03980 [Burkholderiales bacterium]|nr:hypothetical protein [Burkholderiales bacterium]